MAATNLRRAPGTAQARTPRPSRARRAAPLTLAVNLPEVVSADPAPVEADQPAEVSAGQRSGTPSSYFLRHTLAERQQVATEVRYEHGLVNVRSAVLLVLVGLVVIIGTAFVLLLLAHLLIALGAPPTPLGPPVPVPAN